MEDGGVDNSHTRRTWWIEKGTDDAESRGHIKNLIDKVSGLDEILRYRLVSELENEI